MIHDTEDIRAVRLRIEPWPCVEVLIPVCPRPGRVKSWRQVGQRQRTLGCPADIVYPVAWMAGQPCSDEMFIFCTDNKTGIRKRLHDRREFRIHAYRVFVPDCYGTGEQAIGRQVHANFLPGRVDIKGLVGGVRVHDTGLMAR